MSHSSLVLGKIVWIIHFLCVNTSTFPILTVLRLFGTPLSSDSFIYFLPFGFYFFPPKKVVNFGIHQKYMVWHFSSQLNACLCSLCCSDFFNLNVVTLSVRAERLFLFVVIQFNVHLIRSIQ